MTKKGTIEQKAGVLIDALVYANEVTCTVKRLPIGETVDFLKEHKSWIMPHLFGDKDIVTVAHAITGTMSHVSHVTHVTCIFCCYERFSLQ